MSSKTRKATSSVRLAMHGIQPAPENETIYKPVSPDDPSVKELANSIRDYGLKEPIVVTADGYILSGHRRYAACCSLGWKTIPCRVEAITRDDPNFVNLLMTFNRQRVKSFDEQVRETVIATNPDDAYQSLIEHRESVAKISGEFISISGVKTRSRITKAKHPMQNAILAILERLRDFLPLSDRQIHYELLNDPPLRHASKPNSQYVNNGYCYKDTTDLLTRMRLIGLIPFESISDETRPFVIWGVHREIGGFLQSEMTGFLKGYWRDLQQSQPNHIEIIGEKNTLTSSVRTVSAKYRIPYTLGRGYCSIDPRYKMYKRFKASGRQNLIILILSDFDPDGEEIAHSFVRSMRDDFDVEDVKAMKVFLTYDQVIERDLPQKFDIKRDSAQYANFSKKYGDRSHEVEALSIPERERLLTEAIDSVMDTAAFNQELDAEKKDAARLKILREAVLPALASAAKQTDTK